MTMYESIKQVNDNIKKACKKANRSFDEITLLAVSKTKPNSDIIEAYNNGLVYFGENKVQELTQKINTINLPIKWHLIGHLQQNKVKYIIDKVELIHSVDSIRLAKKINDEAIKRNIQSNILLEVNVSNEDSKYGIDIKNIYSVLEEISSLNNINIKGLMTVAPYTVEPEENREFFRTLKNLSVDINNKKLDNISMEILSMGMTNDYEIAIEEGSTIIRVGTGIFGNRNYNL